MPQVQRTRGAHAGQNAIIGARCAIGLCRESHKERVGGEKGAQRSI
jgi:hypothetical protein